MRPCAVVASGWVLYCGCWLVDECWALAAPCIRQLIPLLPSQSHPSVLPHLPFPEQDEIADALERIIAGPEKKGAVMSEKKKKLVAYHEAGHALVGAAAAGGWLVGKQAGGRVASGWCLRCKIPLLCLLNP